MAFFASADWLTTLRRLDIEAVLMPVLVQLVIIILAARLFFAVFRRLGQPGVVGEIAAGLMLGPSLLGRIPAVDAIFHPSLPSLPPEVSDQVFRWIFTILSQLGLVLLLFLIGLEFDFGHLRSYGKSALAISVAGLALPFGLGLALSPLLQSSPGIYGPGESPAPWLSFALFMGAALAITAIPVLGRIMMELGITRTRLGAVTIAAAAVEDATGWIILAAVAGVVRANFEPAAMLLMVAQTVGFALAMIFAVRPVLRWWVRRVLKQGNGEIGLTSLTILLAVIFGCAIATSWIGIFAIFGAFFLGAALSAEHEFREAISLRLRDLVTVFFLPIFFTYTGLRTDVGSLETWELWFLCGLVLAAAISGKFLGCGLAARFSGFSTRESACIGALMNTRGLMELIVINLGYELGVIPRSVFCMLALMALITTLMTTPILLRLMRGTELEPHIERSGFVA